MLRGLQTVYLKHFQLITNRILISSTKSLSYSALPEKLSFHHKESGRQRQRCLKFQTSNIHSSVDLQITLYMFIISGLVVTPAVIGVYSRLWWLKQSTDRQEKYKRWIWEKRKMLYGSLGIYSIILVIFFGTHIEEVPLTKRLRFILTESVQADLPSPVSEFEPLLSSRDRRYIRLARIMKKLTNANKDLLANTQWTINIENTPIVNASSQPDGNISIFSGLINTMDTDDQLAFVLAHEMSHVLLQHFMEGVSYSLVFQLNLVVPTFLTWFHFSRWRALLITIMATLLKSIFILNPQKRILEMEADTLAFEICAKSCMDLREIIKSFDIIEENDPSVDMKVDLSKLIGHPTNKQRKEMLIQQLPKAIELRRQANCPELSKYSRGRRFDIENIIRNINTVL